MASSKWTTTQFNHFENVKRLLLGVYRQAQSFKMECNHFVRLKTTQVYDTNSYKRLTAYYQGKVSGISDTLFNQIQTELVEWKHYYTNRCGRVVYVSKWEQMPKYIREGNLFESNHFWKDTLKPWGKPAIGKGMLPKK